MLELAIFGGAAVLMVGGFAAYAQWTASKTDNLVTTLAKEREARVEGGITYFDIDGVEVSVETLPTRIRARYVCGLGPRVLCLQRVLQGDPGKYERAPSGGLLLNDFRHWARKMSLDWKKPCFMAKSRSVPMHAYSPEPDLAESFIASCKDSLDTLTGFPGGHPQPLLARSDGEVVVIAIGRAPKRATLEHLLQLGATLARDEGSPLHQLPVELNKPLRVGTSEFPTWVTSRGSSYGFEVVIEDAQVSDDVTQQLRKAGAEVEERAGQCLLVWPDVAHPKFEESVMGALRALNTTGYR